MIKRAAAAGAVAWTAPVIIDSLASPAAAATFAVGCYTLQFSSSCVQEGNSNTTGCPLPADWPTYFNSLFPGTSTSSGTGTNTVTITLTNAENCTITGAEGRATGGAGGNQCLTGAAGGTSTSFTKTLNNWADHFRLVICCT